MHYARFVFSGIIIVTSIFKMGLTIAVSCAIMVKVKKKWAKNPKKEKKYG